MQYTPDQLNQMINKTKLEWETKYGPQEAFRSHLISTYGGVSGGVLAQYVMDETIEDAKVAALYVPAASNTAGTLVGDVILGLGGAAAYDVGKTFSGKSLSVIVDDFASAAIGSSSPANAQAAKALKDYANFAAKSMLPVAAIFATAGTGALLINGETEKAAKNAAVFGIGMYAAQIGEKMVEGYAKALAAGELGATSARWLSFAGSNLAKTGGGLLLAGAASFAFSQGWELAKQLHSGALQSDYKWFLGKVSEYAEQSIDELFSGQRPFDQALGHFFNFWGDGVSNAFDAAGGWGALLPEVPDFMKGLLPDWYTPASNQFGTPLPQSSPLVLDLDGDGVEITKLGAGGAAGSSTVYFDIDNDGFAERTAWVTGGDGLLVLDKNNSGKIDNQNELFGNTATYANGFANLKSLDSNGDNKITSADAQWANLKVWIDANSNGVTDSGELKTLTDLKITQINLNAVAQAGLYRSDNLVSDTSTYVINGATRAIEDVWFRNDNRDSKYLGTVSLNVETLFLPTLKGFGVVKDLHVAMSENAANDNGMSKLLDSRLSRAA